MPVSGANNVTPAVDVIHVAPVVDAAHIVPVVGAIVDVPDAAAIDDAPVSRGIQGHRSDYDCLKCLRNGHSRNECPAPKRRYTNNSLDRRQAKLQERIRQREIALIQHQQRANNMPAPPVLRPYHN